MTVCDAAIGLELFGFLFMACVLIYVVEKLK
jgi:hypothetical protein